MDTNKCPKVIDQVLSGDFNDCGVRENEVNPADILAALTDKERENIMNDKGLDGKQDGNCGDIQGGLLCDIRQELEAVLQNQSMTIYANDFSKCSETDENPTLASMWSRIYRFSQAIASMLCAYDPFLANLLKSGKYPQVLMGSPSANGSGYPTWVAPDSYPSESTTKPVSSDGVYRAIEDAILSVWHLWKEHPEFTYYTDTIKERDALTDLEENDTVLVKDAGSKKNVIYRYYNEQWNEEEVVGVDLPNFTVTHIVKGYWADKGMYYFKDGNEPTWQAMDANLTDLERRVDELAEKISHAVLPAPGDTNDYLITTRANLSQANAVPATSGKVTLTFITG